MTDANGTKHVNENGGEKPMVLVVDDEKNIANTLALILRTRNFRAEAAYDGPSGIEMYRSLRPDLVLSDVVMPGMTGIEMGIALKQEFPDSRILLFSGQAAAADLLEDAIKKGYAFEMLAKPIHPEELLAKVTQLLRADKISTP
jgi:CheY-like chemotaxis protein